MNKVIDYNCTPCTNLTKVIDYNCTHCTDLTFTELILFGCRKMCVCMLLVLVVWWLFFRFPRYCVFWVLILYFPLYSSVSV